MTQRSTFATRTGAIAATVGSAVGLGNIWRFPYETGIHGGAAFIIVYIACVLLLGIPVILSEFVIGRSTHKNGVGAFNTLAPRSPFKLAAYMGILASLMILSFYSVVAGWIMEYLFQGIEGLFTNLQAEHYAERFTAFISNPWRPALWTFIFLTANFLVLRRGVEKGIEKISNILMPLLFVLLVVFCANSLSLPKAKEGLSFLFNPDFSQITPSTVIGALGQAFFSLSLGLTCLLTYASYFNDSTRLTRSATIIAILDLLVAILAGVMIFPAVFSYGMQPEAGPKLVFEILPSIFAQMTGGHVWLVLFFLLLFFASLTSTISMSEISISFFIEEHKLSRQNATILNSTIAVVFGTLCALSFGVLSGFTICGKGLFDLFDYVSSNILLPFGGLLLSLFAGWRLDKRILWAQLTNDGKLSARSVPYIRFCMRYLAPIAILCIFIYGLL